MGFISYSLNYYTNKINEFENSPVNANRLYEARQLLKLIDDIIDEGYTSLFITLETEINGIKRLKKYLKDNGVEPFKMPKQVNKNLVYDDKEIEINYALESFLQFGLDNTEIANNDFLDELISFSDSIKYAEDVAYIFLFRDTMIPYLNFKFKDKFNIYPYLISREMIKDKTGLDDYDDVVRNIIINALEEGISDYDSFINYVCPRIKAEIIKEKDLYYALKELLDSLKEDKLMVIESGCYGTMPMLLKAIDNRIDFHMFTCVPYLKKIYQDKIYTPEYEKLRMFETITCQDKLFKYASFHDNNFYVYECLNEDIRKISKSEIKRIKEASHKHV